MDECSTAFTAGEYSGYAFLAAAGAAGGARAAVTTTVRRRAAAGADGAVSQIVKQTSKITGRTVNVTHEVTKGGQTIHKHSKYRRFLPF